MSLIVCAQDCRHQSDGYCKLNQVISLSGSNQAKCGYYEKSALPSTKNMPRQGMPSTEKTEGFM